MNVYKYKNGGGGCTVILRSNGLTLGHITRKHPVPEHFPWAKFLITGDADIFANWYQKRDHAAFELHSRYKSKQR